MEPLKQGEIRVHLNGGASYVSPEANKHNIVNSVGNISRIEHFKPIVAELIIPKPKAKKKAVKKVVVPVEPVEPSIEVMDRKHLGGSQGKTAIVSYDHREGYVYCKAANGAGYKFTLEQWNSGKPLS